MSSCRAKRERLWSPRGTENASLRYAARAYATSPIASAKSAAWAPHQLSAARRAHSIDKRRSRDRPSSRLTMPPTGGLRAPADDAGACAAAPRSSGSEPAGVPSAIGAYGLRVDGLAGAEPWMQAVADDAPRLRVSVTASEPDSGPSHLDEHAAD